MMKFLSPIILIIVVLFSACNKNAKNINTPELTSQVTTKYESLDKSVFGELLNAENTPIVQIKSQYEVDPATRDDLVVNTNGTGTASATTSGNFSITSGTASGDFATIASKNGVIYRSGEGIEARLTAAFTTGGTANSTQFAGMTNVTDRIAFGYSNTTFGIEHSYGGVAQVATITITASSAVATRSVTLNGLTDAALPSVGGGSIADVSSTLVDALNNSTVFSSLWSFQQTDIGAIICVAKQSGPRSGSYALTVPSSTISGSTATGVALTTDFVAQASWNITTSPFAGFDSTMLNIYRITFGYLGVANIVYSVYNPNIGKYVPVHQLKWANTQTFPHTTSPDFSIGIGAQSTGAISARTVQSASMYLAMQGKLRPTNIAYSISGPTWTTGAFWPIVSIANRIYYGNKPNRGKIILSAVNANNEGSNTAIMTLNKNFTISPAEYFYVNEDNSIALTDNLALIYLTTGVEIASFTVPAFTSVLFPLTDLGITLLPGEKFTVGGESVTGTTDISATISWTEDH